MLLHAALEQAIDNGIIVRNVSSRTVLPKMEQKEIRFFTLDEQKRFIDALPDSTADALSISSWAQASAQES